MEDTGGKSARRPGSHLQVEASGPGNAASEQQRLASRFGGNLTRRNNCAGPGSKVDAPEAPSGLGWEIQEVSRVGTQSVTSKSKLLALEMPRLCSAGLRACKFGGGDGVAGMLGPCRTPNRTFSAGPTGLRPRGRALRARCRTFYFILLQNALRKTAVRKEH